MQYNSESSMDWPSGLKIPRSASDVGKLLQKEFGYVALGTDDDLALGEAIPSLTCQSREDAGVSGIVTGRTTYEDYEKQAEFAGFSDTCTDCFENYFKVELREAQ